MSSSIGTSANIRIWSGNARRSCSACAESVSLVQNACHGFMALGTIQLWPWNRPNTLAKAFATSRTLPLRDTLAT